MKQNTGTMKTILRIVVLLLLTNTVICFSQENATITRAVSLDGLNDFTLPANICQHPKYSHVGSIFEIEGELTIQITYKTKGLEQYNYPFKETYEPEYSFEQTAWDTLFFFDNQNKQLKKKIGVQHPLTCIKSLQKYKWPEKEMFLLEHNKKGAELHLLKNDVDSILFLHAEADLVALSPNGKKLTYVNYVESGSDEIYANCLINCNLEKQHSRFPYNYQATEPTDDNEEDIYVSRVAAVPYYNRYDTIFYTSENYLVYRESGKEPVKLNVEALQAPSPVYYKSHEGREYPVVINSKYIDGFLYILSYVNDLEMDYVGYTISMLNVKSNEYIINHMHINVNNNSTAVEYNKQTSSSSEIQHSLVFDLNRLQESDSTSIAKILPEKHKFYLFGYVDCYAFDSNKNTLAFADSEGLIKMNMQTKEFIHFGNPYVLMWFGNSGSTHSLYSYKSVHLTNDDRIITIQENGRVLVWDVEKYKNL